MRWAAARDGNEVECIRPFDKHGWTCLRVSMPGWTDWLCTRQGENSFQELWVEVKKPEGRIEKAQAENFPKMEAAGLVIVVVTSEAEAESVATNNGGGRSWRDFTVRASSKRATKKSRPKLRIPKHLR